MRVSVTLKCDCGNAGSYEVENKYHSEAHETFVDLTDGIYDDKFQAKPIPDGMWVRCLKCNKGYDVI
ncbi:hypothetical protein MOD25_05670 [Bacillus haynesii]|uniref:hypothetical protein n=1 Tax=Bacillus haynesii TaxID=1925021 RepID=UPI0022824540|nr:hypothetical protein [Bacillus haynesii]MCY8549390.1 hypothetical protein [Bacillus haynesii]